MDTIAIILQYGVVSALLWGFIYNYPYNAAAGIPYSSHCCVGVGTARVAIVRF